MYVFCMDRPIRVQRAPAGGSPREKSTARNDWIGTYVYTCASREKGWMLKLPRNSFQEDEEERRKSSMSTPWTVKRRELRGKKKERVSLAFESEKKKSVRCLYTWRRTTTPPSISSWNIPYLSLLERFLRSKRQKANPKRSAYFFLGILGMRRDSFSDVVDRCAFPSGGDVLWASWRRCWRRSECLSILSFLLFLRYLTLSEFRRLWNWGFLFFLPSGVVRGFLPSFFRPSSSSSAAFFSPSDPSFLSSFFVMHANEAAFPLIILRFSLSPFSGDSEPSLSSLLLLLPVSSPPLFSPSLSCFICSSSRLSSASFSFPEKEVSTSCSKGEEEEEGEVWKEASLPVTRCLSCLWSEKEEEEEEKDVFFSFIRVTWFEEQEEGKALFVEDAILEEEVPLESAVSLLLSCFSPGVHTPRACEAVETSRSSGSSKGLKQLILRRKNKEWMDCWWMRRETKRKKNASSLVALLKAESKKKKKQKKRRNCLSRIWER